MLMGQFVQSPKLKTGYQNETHYRNCGFMNVVRQYCRYKYFCLEILIPVVSLRSCSVFDFLTKNLHKNIEPNKGNSGVSFYNTFLTFRLRYKLSISILYSNLSLFTLRLTCTFKDKEDFCRRHSNHE